MGTRFRTNDHGWEQGADCSHCGESIPPNTACEGAKMTRLVTEYWHTECAKDALCGACGRAIDDCDCDGQPRII